MESLGAVCRVSEPNTVVCGDGIGAEEIQLCADLC